MHIVQLKFNGNNASERKKYHTDGWLVILVYCLYNKVENISDDSWISTLNLIK